MLIDGWKNRGLTPEQVPSGEAASFANGKGKKLYIAYQERLKTLNAADFGDLLLENIRLFRQNTDVLRSFQERFKFILVDEYQDTNVAQYLWLKLLAQTSGFWHAVIAGPLTKWRPGISASERRRMSGLAPQPDPSAGECGAAREHNAPPSEKHLLRRRRRPVDLWLARRGGR